jgi:hypothetical protein
MRSPFLLLHGPARGQGVLLGMSPRNPEYLDADLSARSIAGDVFLRQEPDDQEDDDEQDEDEGEEDDDGDDADGYSE